MSLVAEVTLIVVGGIGSGDRPRPRSLFGCRRASRCSSPRLRPRVTTELWPAQLVRLERIVEWSGSSDLDAHTRLRPVLIEIAEVRLARRGLRLDRDVAEARRLLGSTTWELLRPDRPPPSDRDAPGISPYELEEMLEALEAL